MCVAPGAGTALGDPGAKCEGPKATKAGSTSVLITTFPLGQRGAKAFSSPERMEIRGMDSPTKGKEQLLVKVRLQNLGPKTKRLGR